MTEIVPDASIGQVFIASGIVDFLVLINCSAYQINQRISVIPTTSKISVAV